MRSLKSLLVSALRTPAFRALAFSLAAYFVAFQICSYRLWRDPHSAFFDDRYVYDLGYSRVRQEKADEYIRDVNTSQHAPLKGSRGPALCAVVTTFNRGEVEYLSPTVGSMLAGLVEQERRNFHLGIMFTDTDPTKHSMWQTPWLEKVTDSVFTYNVSQERRDWLKMIEGERNFYVKAVYDYIYGLEYCLNNTSSPYIAMFEDDVVTADGWLARTFKGLQDILNGEIDTDSPATITRWIYMRLFYTETSLSWQTEDDFWYRHMLSVIVVAMMITCVVLVSARRRYPQLGKSHLDNWAIAVVCVATVPAFTILLYMVGKYNLPPYVLNGVIEMNKNGCCTQGMVFPRSEVPALIRSLREKGGGQTDTMIEEHANEMKLSRLALAPPVLQHVGLKSSRDNVAINTRSTWAFWFEANDEKELTRDHDRLVNRVINWESIGAGG